MASNETRVLTTSDVLALSVILDAASRCAKVARVLPDGEIAYGTARSLVDSPDRPCASGKDVRDRYLWVTLRSGFETFWAVAELMQEQPSGVFALYTWGE